MNTNPRRGHSFIGMAVLALLMVLGSLVQAQEAPPVDGSPGYDQSNDAPGMDPPDRAARLSLLRGEVSLQPADEDDWAPALLNRPLTTGDRLWTESGGRAEIQVSQSVVRLDSNTGFSFLNLDDDIVQMRLTAGTMILDVRQLAGREQIEVATPNMSLSILRPGSYRVEVNDAGDLTTVKLGQGEAEANGPGQNIIVRSEQMVTFRGTEDLVASWGKLGAPDDFDNWSMERERRGEQLASRSSQYVSPEVTGYDDLDEYGSWSSEAEYGYVWTPTRVAVDWSPYRYGRWVWVAPWGYTWIDDSPWGYAPFHYGRWAHVRNRWCWVPGPRHYRAVYAPALVGWVGTPGLNVSWYPLGPRDVYMPHRHFSRRYVERVNFSNSLIDRARVAAMYDRRGNGRDDDRHRPVNRSVPGAVTAASRAQFTSAQRIGNHRVRFDDRQLANSRDDNRGPQFAPNRESRLGGNARATPRMPARYADRQVIVKRDAPRTNERYTRRLSDVVEARQARDQGQAFTDRGVRPQGGDTRNRPRTDRPVTDNSARSSVFDSRSIQDRVRADRDRQLRDSQQGQALQPERNQGGNPNNNGGAVRDDRPRNWNRGDDANGNGRGQQWQTQREQQQREPNQDRDDNFQRMREAAARQQQQRESQERRESYRQESVPRQAPREIPRQEMPRAERQREMPRSEPRVERQREQPRAEQPRAEQPRQERPQQAPRNDSPRQRDNGPRPNRD